MDTEKMGDFIAELRREKKLTQRQVAEMLYTSRETVSKWERGVNRIDVDILVRLSHIYNVTLNEMIACEKLNDENADRINNAVANVIKKDRKKINVLYKVIIGFIMVFITCIFGLYFITNYNSIKVYSTGAEGEYFDLTQGLIFLSNKRSFIRFGEIFNKTENDVNDLKVYFEYKGKKIYIYDVKDNDALIIDINKYKEILEDKNNFLNNLYVEISNGKESETLKIRTRIIFSNNYFVTFKYDEPLADKTVKSNNLSNEYKDKFTVKTKLNKYECEFNKDINELMITYNGKLIIYHTRINMLDIYDGNKTISYSIEDNKCLTNNCDNYMKIVNDVIENIV